MLDSHLRNNIVSIKRIREWYPHLSFWKDLNWNCEISYRQFTLLRFSWYIS